MADEQTGKNEDIGINSLHETLIYFDWSMLGTGFGQMRLTLNPETKKVEGEVECMSPESVRRILHAFADHLADNMVVVD